MHWTNPTVSLKTSLKPFPMVCRAALWTRRREISRSTKGASFKSFVSCKNKSKFVVLKHQRISRHWIWFDLIFCCCFCFVCQRNQDSSLPIDRFSRDEWRSPHHAVGERLPDNPTLSPLEWLPMIKMQGDAHLYKQKYGGYRSDYASWRKENSLASHWPLWEDISAARRRRKEAEKMKTSPSFFFFLFFFPCPPR